MPDSIRSWGELIAPPATITSRAAPSVSTPPALAISTPVARPFCTSTRRVRAPVMMVRFGRPAAGCRKAREVDSRSPFLWVTSQ